MEQVVSKCGDYCTVRVKGLGTTVIKKKLDIPTALTCTVQLNRMQSEISGKFKVFSHVVVS